MGLNAPREPIDEVACKEIGRLGGGKVPGTFFSARWVDGSDWEGWLWESGIWLEYWINKSVS
jgi:hypothetical protein